MEVEMLHLLFQDDPNKLLQLINFKNILMNPKLKFRRMLHPEFLEFQEFQRPHLKLCLLPNQKPLKLMPSQKSIHLILKEMRTRTLVPQQLQPSKLFPQLHHIKQPRFFKTNTNNFQLSMKTLLNKIKQWKKKYMTSKMKQIKRQNF